MSPRQPVERCAANVGHSTGLVGSFEFLWYLERWNAPRTVLGVTAVVFIQRAVNKFIISTMLTREFKSDETNRVWWAGTWFGRNASKMGVSTPGREFLVKIVELTLWSGDFLLGHILLFFLSLPVLIPYADRIHATSKSFLPRKMGLHCFRALTNCRLCVFVL